LLHLHHCYQRHHYYLCYQIYHLPLLPLFPFTMHLTHSLPRVYDLYNRTVQWSQPLCYFFVWWTDLYCNRQHHVTLKHVTCHGNHSQAFIYLPEPMQRLISAQKANFMMADPRRGKYCRMELVAAHCVLHVAVQSTSINTSYARRHFFVHQYSADNSWGHETISLSIQIVSSIGVQACSRRDIR
jgi:hypothetical protein